MIGLLALLWLLAPTICPAASAPGSTFIEVVTLRNHNTRLVVLASILLGAVSGWIGSFLLLRKRALIGDTLSHAALPGLGLAFLIMVAAGGSGRFLPGLLIGAALSGLVGVFLVSLIRQTTRLKDDAAMGIVLSVFFGLGTVILSAVSHLPLASAAGLDSFLYGKAASLTRSDFSVIASVTVLSATVSAALSKELSLLCFDPNLAATQGWPVRFLDAILLLLVAAITIIGLQSVGLILIVAFLIIPATAARFWTHRLPILLPLSAAIGAASGWLGTSLSAMLAGWPAGAVSVLAATVLFVLSLLFGTSRGLIQQLSRRARLRRRIGRQHFLRSAFELIEREQPNPSASLTNQPFLLADLQRHRSWKPSRLRRLIRRAHREDHIDSSADSPPHSLLLSESGFGEAARVTRNHRLWELYLIHHADIAPNHVDRDADWVEHVLGAELVRQIEDELTHAQPPLSVPESPHDIQPPTSSDQQA